MLKNQIQLSWTIEKNLYFESLNKVWVEKMSPGYHIVEKIHYSLSILLELLLELFRVFIRLIPLSLSWINNKT